MSTRKGGGMHDFRVWLRREGYAAKTITIYTGYARRAQALLGSLRGVSTEELEEFLDTLPPTAPSRRAARKALSAYYRHRGGKNPADALSVPPEPERLPRPIDEADYDAYIATAARLGGAHRLVGYVFAYTGCRFSELRFARWDQMSLSGRDPSWRIRGKGSRRRGAKERVIPLHPALVDVLKDWKRSTPRGDYLLTGVRRPWASEDTIRALHRDIIAAIRPGTVPHQIRHTVLTLGLDRTGDPLAVRDFAGHASLATTQGYTRLLPGRLRAVSDALG